MKKEIINTAVSILLVSFIWFTILFDPTGVALGLKVINLPLLMVGTAEIFGNIIWILGLLLFLSVIVFTILIFYEGILSKEINENIDLKLKNNENEISPYTLKDKNNNPLFRKKRWYYYILSPLALIGSLLAIGSGFWFTGSAWLLSILVAHIYRKRSIALAHKIINEERNNESNNIIKMDKFE